jgi:hypothetical protein
VKVRVESGAVGVRWDLVNCRRRETFLLNMKQIGCGDGRTREMRGGYERLFMLCVLFTGCCQP